MLREFTVLQPDSCDGCGLCCEGIGSPVLVYQSRSDHGAPPMCRPPGLPRALTDEIDAHFLGLSRGQEPQGMCLWYDPEARRCRHYEWRPPVCREYELGGRACVELRRPFLSSACGSRADS